MLLYTTIRAFDVPTCFWSCRYIDIFSFYLAKLAIQNMIMKCPARAKETATKTIAGH